ncbi:MAG TPA: hypothetical protein VNA69_21605 [Thermoanaerobaculia bacterium]|nr:hypothetical protein [Thermoanaerobaculia bacterium]
MKILLLLLCALPALGQPITGGFLESEPGDAVGRGFSTSTFRYESTDVVSCGWWNGQPPPVPYYITCSIGPAAPDPNRPRAYLTFTEWTRDVPLNRGVYESAYASPHNFFHLWPHPGLHVKLEGGLSPYELVGRFAVLDYEVQTIDGVLTPVRFAAYFEQHWSNQRPALRGFFYWNYTPAVSVSLVSPTVTGGQKTRARVTLTKPAPVGGATVTLRSSNALASLSRSEAVIAEGMTVAEVDVQTTVARWTDRVLIYAESNGVGGVAPLTVVSPYTALTEIEVNVMGERSRHSALDAGSVFEAMSLISTIPASHLPTSVRVRDFGPAWEWQIEIDTSRTNTPLRAGTYENVQAFSHPSGSFARMSVNSVNGTDVDDVCAGFPVRSLNVVDATYDETFNLAVLKSLAIEFQCLPADGGPGVTGHAYWNYVPPGSEPEPPPPSAPSRRRSARH